MSGLKRSLEDSSHDADLHSPSDSSMASVKPASPTVPTASAASSFRNVSACNRCRLRKNRCDQRLPSCASCDKANIKCVGYDPITKREIPRRYEEEGRHQRRMHGAPLTRTQLCLLPRNPRRLPRDSAAGQFRPVRARRRLQPRLLVQRHHHGQRCHCVAAAATAA